MRKALALLVVVAACSSCSSGGRRPTPVEAPKDHIIIPHDFHAKLEITCDTCHAGIATETALGTAPTSMPTEATCLQCHQEHKDGNDCAFCHTDVKHAAPPNLAEATVAMSHKNHIERVKGNCATCHKQLPEPFASADKLPKMSDCLTCHEHDKDYAQAQCTGCHPTLNRVALKPLSDFSHQGNYIARHGADARSSAETCSQCHDQTYCADCHAKTVATRVEVKFPEAVAAQFIHRNDFLGRHPFEAKLNEASCRKCHGQSFCDSCHTAQNLTPVAVRPRDPHPVGWTIPGSGDFHGEAARRDIASCASCHDQGASSNCVSCHRVGGLGGNPHPASWMSHHDHDEIKSNGMCTTCHF